MKPETTDRGSIFSHLFWGVVFFAICGVLFTMLVLPGFVHYKAGKGSAAFDMAQDGSGHHQTLVEKYRRVDAAEIEPVEGITKPGLDLQAALEGSAEQLAAGQALFVAQCAACHGNTGKGDGPAGAALGARDMTIEEGWVNGNRVTDIVRTLSKGLPPKMPTFEHLPAADRFALAHYVISLGDFSHSTPPASEIQALDEEFAFSQDQFEPNRVAVSVAMSQLDKENRGLHSLRYSDLSKEQARLLLSVVSEPARVYQALKSLEGWRKDRELFNRSLLAGYPLNGFHEGLMALDGGQWRDLHGALQLAVD